MGRRNVVIITQLILINFINADPNLDRNSYCKQFLPNFKYFCSGPGSGDSRLGNFCPSYSSTCNVPSGSSQQPPSSGAAGPNVGSGSGIGSAPIQAQQPNYGTPQLCYQYQYLAQTSCTNPQTENAYSRYYCNYYRQFCLFTQSSPGVVQLQTQQAADPRCGPYQKPFEVTCLRQPITVATAQFCQSYVAYCSNYQAPAPTAIAPSQVPPQVPAAAPQVPQTAAQVPAPAQLPQQLPQAGNVSPQQVQQLCSQYQTLALQNCKGNEAGQIKQYCDLYRQNCINHGRRRRWVA